MKKLLLILGVVVLLVSCDAPGVSETKLFGVENTLPTELKGLKIYSVSTGSGSYVKVAILNNNVNSLTYLVGKDEESTIILNEKSNGRTIIAKEIISENDSILVIRKK